MTTTTATYLSIANNLPARLAQTAATPQVKTASAYYQANIGKVSSISDFVNNYQLFSYAMTAYGLGDMTYAKGEMTKVLEQGTSSSTALANTLNDPRILAFANAFSSLAQGSAPTSASTTTTVNNYVQQTLDDNAGQQNQGVELALYFQQNASSVTNAYGLLADSNLLKVVDTAFGLPQSATADIDSEAATLSKDVTPADLQDPTKVQQIAERFTAMWDLAGNNTSSDTSSISQLFGSSSTQAGISTDLLLSIQGLRLGGP